MATRDFAYDHPAYTTVHHAPIGTWATTGAGLPRFVAFTDMIIKSITVVAIVAGTGTANNYVNGIKISGTGTRAVTTSGTILNVAGTNPYTTGTCSIALAAGDTFNVVGVGTDATGIYSGAIEYCFVNGADFTSGVGGPA